MRFPTPLLPGILLRRYKRFLADIKLDDGREITAHCANPGSMLGVAIEGAQVWVSEHLDGKRKLPFSWQLINLDGVLVPINTSNPNKIAGEALDQGAIPELSGYESHRAEVKYGAGSRVDFLLEHPRKSPCYLEIKNVHLSRQKGLAEFPDSVSARGTKHLRELMAVKAEGARAVMLFIVQRSDCGRLAPAADLDPTYAETLLKASCAGVELIAYDCEVTTTEVVLRKALEIILTR